MKNWFHSFEEARDFYIDAMFSHSGLTRAQTLRFIRAAYPFKSKDDFDRKWFIYTDGIKDPFQIQKTVKKNKRKKRKNK